MKEWFFDPITILPSLRTVCTDKMKKKKKNERKANIFLLPATLSPLSNEDLSCQFSNHYHDFLRAFFWKIVKKSYEQNGKNSIRFLH